MSSLPAELIYLILDDIPKNHSTQTLHSLTLTSKLFNGVATPLLYDRMVSKRSSRHRIFLKTLMAPGNQELARLVRVYHLPEAEAEAEAEAGNDDTGDMDTGLWMQIRAGLQLMVNLKELVIRSVVETSDSIRATPTSPGGPPIFDEGISVTPPFQLTKLICKFPFSALRPKDIDSFVAAQFSLEYLVWKQGNNGPQNLPDTLRCVVGAPGVVKRLLSGCIAHSNPIREVCLVNDLGSRPYTSRMFRALWELEAFRHVRVLNLVSIDGARLLPYIRRRAPARQFASLEVLVLGNLRACRQDPEILLSFPRLRELIITMSEPNATSWWLMEQQRTISALFAKNKNLIEVDARVASVGDVDGLSEKYRRWVGGRLLDGYYTLSGEKTLEFWKGSV